MIVIKPEHEQALMTALKTTAMSLEATKDMSEEQLLHVCSQFEQFSFIQEMLKSKLAKDIVQDQEIKLLLNDYKEILQKEYKDLMEIITDIESQA